MEKTTSDFQMPITIGEVVNSIHAKRYLLPAIQREFVWKTEQIESLFDSLMRGYPIGSFLLWQVEKEKIKDFQFYEFVRDYHERDNKHNPKANITGEGGVTAVLDGQQRLTALYIGLKGSHSLKSPRRRWENENAFPRRKLYLNILSSSEQSDSMYDFKFIADDDVFQRDSKQYWFDVSKIMDFESLRDINAFLRENDLLENPFAEQCLFGLFELIKEKRVINYYLEKSQELDKVLNIFIRVNSGGTLLTYSDMLLSIATAQWKTRDAREEINSFVDEINRIGEGFEFDKDFVLKSCLYLCDIPEIGFKVDNFNKENMEKIEAEWENVEKALRISIELVSSLGYNAKTLSSKNAVIPIAYHLMKNNNPIGIIKSSDFKGERQIIAHWLQMSLLKRIFGGTPDAVLGPLRTILRNNHDKYPLEEIIEKFRGKTKSFIFTEDDIDALLKSKYGQSYTFIILSLLYPTLDFNNRFHVDHIFPRSFFKKDILREHLVLENKIPFYLESFDCIGNLQLLEGIPNEEKSDKEFKDWLHSNFEHKEAREAYMEKNFIPKDISLDVNNFDVFMDKRNQIIRKKIKEVMKLD